MEDLVKDIKKVMFNDQVNACPLILRLAWHAAGTYDKSDNSGGSNGATMRFEPESTDDANNGLDIARKMLEPVIENNPNLSTGDIWAVAGSTAIECMGGPKTKTFIGREDKESKYCPQNGRLPDANLGAKHLRDVFYRMGFNDQEIVALSGAHTVGSCHKDRSGFEGKWTSDPLKFDNEYFKVLLNKSWKRKSWDGPEQYEDETGELMMLPTDIALITDNNFYKYVNLYAEDQDKFFEDFAKAFSKLQTNGCPFHNEKVYINL